MLIGGDNWERFPRWYRADDIVSNYQIIVYPRRGSDIDLKSLPPTVSVV
jgi:nicotinate-nucleotide adenylyltransferase